MDKVIVIKYGGSVLNSGSVEEKSKISKGIVSLKEKGFKIVIVHGGSREIDNAMKQANMKLKKIRGKRYTDKETLKLLEQCFLSLNTDIVTSLNDKGGRAVGFHGLSGGIVRAVKEKTGELGCVGEVKSIDRSKITAIWNQAIPVISPLAFNEFNGELYNVNADEVAAEVAISLPADYFILMSDVEGICNEEHKKQDYLSVEDAEKYIEYEIATEGMIPKLQACINAITKGVDKAIIIMGEAEMLLTAVKHGSMVGTTICRTEDVKRYQPRTELVAY